MAKSFKIFVKNLNQYVVVDKKISKSELAKSAEISRGQLDDYLSGKTIPRLDTAEKIAFACGVSLQAFLGVGFQVDHGKLDEAIDKILESAGLLKDRK